MARTKKNTRNTLSQEKLPSRRRQIAKSAVDLLRAPILYLAAHNQKPGPNSKYKGRPIEIEDIKVWTDFVTVEEIEELWEGDPEMGHAMKRPLTVEELESCTIGRPVAGYNLSESSLEKLWGSVQHRLNLVSYVGAKAKQKTSTPLHVVMGDGTGAQWISPQAEIGAGKERPDHAGYLFRNGTTVDHKQTFNRIPGDAKLYRKIRREMLPPDGSKFNARLKNREALKVLSQIHGYMDARQCRFGYLITDQELIFIRRRGTGWGHIDISQAIRHDVEADRDSGTLNSSYVLYYFHWKIANEEDTETGWQLPSCAPGLKPANTIKQVAKKQQRAAIKRLQLLNDAKDKRWSVSNQLLGAVDWVMRLASRRVDDGTKELGQISGG